jgi:putative flippase GtrA
MRVFIRSQCAAFAATLVDFGLTVCLVEMLSLFPVKATILGAMAGAATSFSMGRKWVFKATEGKMFFQLAKYGLVWLGSMALNATGMYFFTHLLLFPYLLAKTVTAAMVGVGYNFLLHRNVVFYIA